jgi:hypothetical protein
MISYISNTVITTFSELGSRIKTFSNRYYRLGLDDCFEVLKKLGTKSREELSPSSNILFLKRFKRKKFTYRD